MAGKPTVEELLVRLTRLEQEVAAGMAAAGEERTSSNGHKKRVGRRDVLKMAGIAAASAGAALVTSTTVSAADGGNVILGGSGDTSNPNYAENPTEVHLDGTVNPKVILLANDTTYLPSNAGYPAAVAGWGDSRSGVYGFSANGAGVVGSGASQGVIAVAGGITATGLATGQGVNATGSGSGPGVYSTGGASNGPGVYATGGATNGPGVQATGSGSGPGVYATGGATNGPGVQATGVGTGPGVLAYGGLGGTGVSANANNGWGVIAQGGDLGTGLAASGGNHGMTGTSIGGVGGLFTGRRAPISLSPASIAGPPTTSSHVKGDVCVDSLGTVWICTADGNPGALVPLQQGGLGNALFTAVSTQQYTLPNSNGLTWVDLDGTTLKLVITPTFKCLAVLTGNCDLWTANASYNQDLGIAISGGAYPTTPGQPEAWKESGGFAGTFSPNAAFVQTVRSLAAGTTYTVKLQWKANKPASGATIYAGAGPIPAGSSTFSPTLLTALLVVTA